MFCIVLQKFCKLLKKIVFRDKQMHDLFLNRQIIPQACTFMFGVKSLLTRVTEVITNLPV